MVIDYLLRRAGEGKEEKKPRGLIQWEGKNLSSLQPYDVMTNIPLRQNVTCIELFAYHIRICALIMESAKPYTILMCIPI